MTLNTIFDHKIHHSGLLMKPVLIEQTKKGTKTETRRTTKLKTVNQDPDEWILDETQILGKWIFHHKKTKAEFWVSSPYGKAGDLIWLREKWRPISWDWEEGMGAKIEFGDRSTLDHVKLFGDDDDAENAFFEKLCDLMSLKCEPKENEEDETFSWTAAQISEFMPWRSPLHLPKTAARIWLNILDVRIDRLQNINGHEVHCEGIGMPLSLFGESHQLWTQRQLQNFKRVWNNINGEKAFERNPWVWVVRYEVLSTSGAPSLELLNSLNLIPA